MKTDLQSLQDYFKIGWEAYEDSKAEAQRAKDYFHNRHYTEEELAILSNRGQPPETFNVVKLFARLLLGYYSTVVNTIKVSPRQYTDVLIASLLNDVVDYTFENNQFETEGDKIKLDGILAGLMCAYVNVTNTKEKDQFGRTIKRIEMEHVPESQIVLDPMSTKEDYSDGRFIHRYKWVSEDKLRKLFKKKQKEIDSLPAYDNHLNSADADFELLFKNRFVGKYKMYNNYLLVHTIVEGDDDEWYSVFWVGDVELDRKRVTYKEVKNPYRVHKIHTSEQTEYYGIFREVLESQRAINQALLKIQLMVNSQKAFVQDGAVEDIGTFTDQFNRVNAVIPVKKLSGIKVENLAREVLDQYAIIDKALDRIQRVLGVNDSFLGMAYASDSGRKVKLQQQATILSLRYVSSRFEQFYRLLGWDVVNLVKQYYTANQVLRISDDSVGERWVELNRPAQIWTGQIGPDGQPLMDYVWEEVKDPATGEPMQDDKGNLVIAPVPERETEVAFADVDLSIDTVIYNDEDEKNQLMLETILQGTIGQTLLSANPAGFMRAAALSVRGIKAKRSLDISDILEETANILRPAQPMDPRLANGIYQAPPKSMDQKLPQNTNEGA